MVISHELKFIFIHVHRTGGTTLEDILIKKLGAKYVSISQHGNAKSSEKEFIKNNPNYTIIGFTRNPWDRILSWYSLLMQDHCLSISEEKNRFETFLTSYKSSIKSDPHFHFNQLDYFPCLNDIENPIKLYRFEDYETNVKALLLQYGLSLDKIPITNTTKTKDYHDYYTQNSKQIIDQLCREDISYFKYSF